MGKMDCLQVLSIVPYIFKRLLTVLSISLCFLKRILKFLPYHSLLQFLSVTLYLKKCRKSRDMPTRGRDVFRPVTLQVQEDFRVETGRI